MRQCNECNLHVCTEHRLPEKHNCPAMLEAADDTESDNQWFDEKFKQVDSEQLRGDSSSRLRNAGLLLVAIGLLFGLLIFMGTV